MMCCSIVSMYRAKHCGSPSSMSRRSKIRSFASVMASWIWRVNSFGSRLPIGIVRKFLSLDMVLGYEKAVEGFLTLSRESIPVHFFPGPITAFMSKIVIVLSGLVRMPQNCGEFRLICTCSEGIHAKASNRKIQFADKLH